MVKAIDNLEAQDLAIFSYPKTDLQKVWELRTSYIGKMRSDKNNPDFIDRMALTDGEDFLSDDMLLDAIVHVHQWLQAFTREMDNAYGIDSTGNVIFTLQPRNWWNRTMFPTVELHIKEALVEYVIYKWFEYVNPDEAQVHFDKYEEHAHEAQMGMNESQGSLMRRHNTPFNTIYEGE